MTENYHIPIMQVGQIYLNEDLNEYLIITNSDQGYVSYKGTGFTGKCDVEDFIPQFKPVDPEDVDELELAYLLGHCPSGTRAKIGWTQ